MAPLLCPQALARQKQAGPTPSLLWAASSDFPPESEHAAPPPLRKHPVSVSLTPNIHDSSPDLILSCGVGARMYLPKMEMHAITVVQGV